MRIPRLRRTLAGIVVATAIAFTLTAAPTAASSTHQAHQVTIEAVESTRAPLHIQDNYALWYCAWSRIYSEDVVVHAKWVYLDSDAAGAYCRASHNGQQYQWRIFTGIPIGDYPYIMWVDYRWCADYYCYEP